MTKITKKALLTPFVLTERRKPFDWNKFLNKKTISKDEWHIAKELANSWVTCACGNQCAIIPRWNSITNNNSPAEPKDKKLNELGYRFNGDISLRYVEEAKETLKKIEARSTILIKRELVKWTNKRAKTKKNKMNLI